MLPVRNTRLPHMSKNTTQAYYHNDLLDVGLDFIPFDAFLGDLVRQCFSHEPWLHRRHDRPLSYRLKILDDCQSVTLQIGDML